MAESRAPLHLGGPLGAIGLGCVGGAMALAIAALNNEPPNLASESQPAPIQADGAQSAPAAGTLAAMPNGPLRQPAGDPPPAGIAAPAGDIVQIQGGSDEGSDQLQQRPARAEGTEVHFIVRLKGAPEVDIITRNFKRDPAQAEAAWAELVARVPAMAEFTLVGASYSGEMKLAYQMPPGAPATPEEIRAVQDRILKVEGVSYADPDYVAHPGKDTPP